ncbi:MAG: sulfur carrier protein ThiS [Actinomycetota bacterium]|nr:sulfur carrier protein ThiS [Actinomycetota bacterium]
MISVNGEARAVPEGTTVIDLIASLGHDPAGRGIAAAVNGEVTPRSAWGSTVVGEGDRVEILAAIGGG